MIPPQAYMLRFAKDNGWNVPIIWHISGEYRYCGEYDDFPINQDSFITRHDFLKAVFGEQWVQAACFVVSEKTDEQRLNYLLKFIEYGNANQQRDTPERKDDEGLLSRDTQTVEDRCSETAEGSAKQNG
jgi:hypothetical protein